MKLKNEDLRVDTFTNSSHKVFMRIVHTPTGAVVEGEGVSQYRLKKVLIEKLKGIVELGEI